MREKMPWSRGGGWGWDVGGAVTLCVAVAHLLGAFDSPDMSLLDWKFRHVNRIPADPSIVMIDINDYAVDRIHKWPWPRRLTGDLIRTLHDLGARAILVDLVWSEPTDGRIDDPRLKADYEVDHVGHILGGATLDEAVEQAVWDDRELADAIRQSGPVYIAMFGRLDEPGRSVDRIREQAYALFAADLGTSFESFRSRLGRLLGDEARANYEALRIAYLLEKESFALTREQVAGRLGNTLPDVEKYFAPAKRRVARRLVRDYLGEHPQADFPEVYRHFFPDKPVDVFTADRADLLRAYRVVRSERETIDRAPPVPAPLLQRLRTVSDVTLPIDTVAPLAHVGYVSFETRDTGGVLRRVPLLVNVAGRLVKQLGFALACGVLDVDDRTIELEGGRYLTLRSRDGSMTWHVPIDAEGETLLNWHVDQERPAWAESFTHVPVSRVMEIPVHRRDLQREEDRLALLRAACVEIQYADLPAAYNYYARLVRRRNQMRASSGGGGPGPSDLGIPLDTPLPKEVGHPQSGALEDIEAEIAAIEQKGVEWVIYLGQMLRDDREAGGDAWREEERADWIIELADGFRSGRLEGEVKAARARLQERIDEQIGALKPLIAGRCCLVGYTASAVADMVPTPVFDTVPGVMAHANVVNSMLQHRFPRSVPGWINALLLLAAGLTTTSVTSRRGPWVSLVSVALIVATLLVIAVGMFRIGPWHVDVAGALVGVFGSWSLVTLYRQLTEGRQRRALGKALAQYTSPAIASQITRRARDLDLSPQPREVTCFFSDLAGFTAISERLGAGRTRDLLNPYLEAMSTVLIESNAMINKFMGDGIFAFFNPPILPADDHARSACEASLRSFDVLEALKERLAAGVAGGDAAALSMRIGLCTGEVFVGDYGSSSKLDYTCIGDTVNLAARLEPANKIFGTKVLVSESTRQAASEGFVYRPLGRLLVVGKEEAIPVYELVGRRDEVAMETLAYTELFAEAVASFQARDWPGALAALRRCRAIEGHDPAAIVLEGNIRHCQQSEPPAHWNQAIELTVK